MKTIFWNVDTQYDFMRNDESFKGTLAIPGAREIEGNLEKLTKYARANAIQVVNTADWHTLLSPELSETPDYKSTFPPHCLQNTKGAQFIPATKPKNPYYVYWTSENFDEKTLASHKGDIVIYKDAFDVFAGNKYTDKVLEMVNPQRVVVYGVATNVCVDYAVNGLLDRRREVYVVKDSIKELPNLPLEETLGKWQSRGARFISTDDVLKSV